MDCVWWQQKEFFDEALLKRVEQATPKSNANSNNKAARQIPADKLQKANAPTKNLKKENKPTIIKPKKDND